MAPKTDSTKALDTVVRRELVRSIRKMAQDSEWQLHLAFEKAGCSCHPQRRELELLQEERERRRESFEDQLDKELGERIEALHIEVREIDAREHPALNSSGRRASYFFALWMLEKLRCGDVAFLEDDSEARELQFAEAWLNGWRPSLERC